MVDIHQCVAVNSLKGGISQAILDHFERLGCYEFSFGSYDPDHVAICLKGVDLVGIQEKVFFAYPSYNFLHTLCGLRACDFLKLRDSFEFCFSSKPLPPLYSFREPLLLDGFKQVVNRASLEGLNRKLIISRNY